MLRYDKRGVGQSGGTYSNVGIANSNTMFALLGADAAAGVRFLRQRPRIDARRVGLAGNSQAGWIIPVAATLAPEATYAVILAGPTTSVGIEIFYSIAEQTSTPLTEVVKQLPGYTGPRVARRHRPELVARQFLKQSLLEHGVIRRPPIA